MLTIPTPWLPMGWHYMATPFGVLSLRGHEMDAMNRAHERQHIKDMWCLLWVGYGILYGTRRGRKWLEVRAFRAELAAGRPLGVCAEQLADNYNLNINKKQAVAALLGG